MAEADSKKPKSASKATSNIAPARAQSQSAKPSKAATDKAKEALSDKEPPKPVGFSGTYVPAEEPKTRKTPRPPVRITDEVMTAIFNRMAAGEPLTKICESPGMPDRSGLYRALYGNEKYQKEFRVALQMRSLNYAEELITLEDKAKVPTMVNGVPLRDADGQLVFTLTSESVSFVKMQVNTRQWIISRLLPTTYGDRLMVDAKVTTNPVAAVLNEVQGASIQPVQGRLIDGDEDDDD